ncbi:hypothetical protein I0P70_06850 [Pontibacter sp. FD36]|uniref:hypothetical protein n=1 Tax=Pontibacter sp. FD36 TaxID=2789860 RepID=UPI0018AB7B13|nr:hypothetical protein [Pontibacter sp. FD36]MBF8962957.1 hypothetical protein [Pontibacter sp. FD36]
MNNKTLSSTNKEEQNYGSKLKYMLCKDMLILNLIPKVKGTVFNFNVFEKDFKPDTMGVYNIGNSYTLHQIRIPDSGYNYSLSINRSGEHIGMIHLNGRGYRYGLIKLEFANEGFYHDSFGWHQHHLNICELLGLKLGNISVLHIALDSTGLFEWYETKYFKSTMNPTLQNPEYEPFGNIKPLNLAGEFIVGKQTSGKVIALYGKSPEIKHSGKDYVTKAHLLNGLDLGKGIDRLEARLGTKWLNRNGISLEDLTTQEGLERIFAKAISSVGFKNLLLPKVRDRNDHYDYVRLPLICPTTFDTPPLNKIVKDKGQTGKRSERAITNRFKGLFDDYIETGRLQVLNFIKFYMSCEENFLVTQDDIYHNRVFDANELSMAKYRTLVRRYVKSYTKDRKVINNALLGRLKGIEEKLFKIDNSELASEITIDNWKILSATSLTSISTSV